MSQNRHAIMMTLLPATPLINIKEMENAGNVLNKCLDLYVRFLQLGLIHCDFNQFNLLVSDSEDVYVIDFPQMVSADHSHAEELFERDLICLNKYFSNRFGVECEEMPDFNSIEIERRLD